MLMFFKVKVMTEKDDLNNLSILSSYSFEKEKKANADVIVMQTEDQNTHS